VRPALLLGELDRALLIGEAQPDVRERIATGDQPISGSISGGLDGSNSSTHSLRSGADWVGDGGG
jgi:hypothetical protein